MTSGDTRRAVLSPHPHRAWNIADTLDLLLDDLEWLYTEDLPALDLGPVPLSSGLFAFDQLCGGLRGGQLTLVESDLGSQARALLCTIARSVDHPALLSVSSISDGTRWLLAGAAAIPATLIDQGHLAATDWNAIASGVRNLAGRDISLTECAHINGLAELIVRRRPEVVLVEQLERFGQASDVVRELSALAERTGAALLATSAPLKGWTAPPLYRVTHLSMHAHGLGAQAAIVASDDFDPLAVHQASVDLLTANLR